MKTERGTVDVGTLLQVILGIIAIVLTVRILEYVLGWFAWIIAPFSSLLVLLIGLVVVLWLMAQL